MKSFICMKHNDTIKVNGATLTYNDITKRLRLQNMNGNISEISIESGIFKPCYEIDKPKVIIEILGGVAHIKESPNFIDVEIIDYDNEGY